MQFDGDLKGFFFEFRVRRPYVTLLTQGILLPEVHWHPVSQGDKKLNDCLPIMARISDTGTGISVGVPRIPEDFGGRVY